MEQQLRPDGAIQTNLVFLAMDFFSMLHKCKII